MWSKIIDGIFGLVFLVATIMALLNKVTWDNNVLTFWVSFSLFCLFAHFAFDDHQEV